MASSTALFPRRERRSFSFSGRRGDVQRSLGCRCGRRIEGHENVINDDNNNNPSRQRAGGKSELAGSFGCGRCPGTRLDLRTENQGHGVRSRKGREMKQYKGRGRIYLSRERHRARGANPVSFRSRAFHTCTSGWNVCHGRGRSSQVAAANDSPTTCVHGRTKNSK